MGLLIIGVALDNLNKEKWWYSQCEAQLSTISYLSSYPDDQTTTK